ncbi:MAG: cytochrome c biogenesis protein CcsA [Bacteroidota bacterium]
MMKVSDLYKVIGVGLVLYAILYGLLATLPELGSLEQSSRNMFYHVPMWFVVIVLMTISVVHSVKLLRETDPDREITVDPMYADARARAAAQVGTIFIVLGLVSGSIWGRVAWKAHMPVDDLSIWWTNDPILICAAISLFVYLAYFLLRSSFGEPLQRAKASAAYNIFAFATLIPLYFIIPKMLPGLHPTAGGSASGGGSFIFKQEGFDNLYRMIMYPGMLGFIFLGVWMYELQNRWDRLKIRMDNLESDRVYNTP